MLSFPDVGITLHILHMHVKSNALCIYHRISNIGGYACISTGKKYAPISEDALINEGRFFVSNCASVITNSGCGS